MEVLDATSLANRLKWESKEYWLHLEAGTPLDKYPAKQHARRVQEKLGVEAGLIYLAGQPSKNNEDSDMPAPFRQRRYFYYLSGCNETDCHLTYDIQHDTLSLFIPRIDEKRVIWNGRGSTLAEALVKYDVDEVYYSDEISDFVADWFLHSRNGGCLFALHAAQTVQGEYAIDTTSLQPAMNLARMIKDDHEIQLIQKANDISSAAHTAVLANILRFKNEAQVEGLFLDVCISRQAKEQAYDPIAASGPNAGTLHYDANNEAFDDRQLMCLDAGCEYQLYASDITRTFPLASSWPSKEAESIYKLVERMQESCIERLAPGVRYLDLHILAHQIAIDGLLQLGILHNGTKEEIYKAGTSKAFFPHGLGHHVGLEVHDVGQAELMSVRRGKPVLDQASLSYACDMTGSDQGQAPSLYPEGFHESVYDSHTCHAPTDPQSSQLEEGMVVTVEPGIYFSVYALQHFYLPSPKHAKYINVDVLLHYLPVGGVRIEDDILITSKGYKNLTSAPKGDAMLAIIRSGKSTGEGSPFANYQPRARGYLEDQQAPLMRAPGIAAGKQGSMLKPIARATTMPSEFRGPDTVELEPFAGPSLFSNFKRAMTTDERIQRWQQERDSALAAQEQSRATSLGASLCGDSTKDVRHIYTTREADGAPQSCRNLSRPPSTDCSKCIILSEALIRLRKNLTMSEHPSPKLGDEAQLRRRSSSLETREQSHWHSKVVRKLDVPEPRAFVPSVANLNREPTAPNRLTLDSLTSLKEASSASDFKKQLKHLQRKAGHTEKEVPTLLPQSPPLVPKQSTFRNMPTSIEEWRKHQDAQLEMLRTSQRVARSSLEQTPHLKEDAPDARFVEYSRAMQTLNDLRLQRELQAELGIKSVRCTLGSEQAEL